MMHVDDWLDAPAADEAERLAKEWIEHFRRPAIEKDYKWLGARILTCDYKGERFRCIGASRMGDVWLTRDMSKEKGYDRRIDVADCSNWLLTPNLNSPTGDVG